jgi:hypothetical protein
VPQLQQSAGHFLPACSHKDSLLILKTGVRYSKTNAKALPPRLPDLCILLSNDAAVVLQLDVIGCLQ